MNDIRMKMIVPPTVGILVAGVASGIFYLLVESLRKGKGSKSLTHDDSHCACCLKPFFIGRGVECNECGARSCRKACCRWDSVENSWYCLFCYHNRTWAKRREKWFRSFGGLPVEPENSKSFSTAKSRVYDEGAEHVAIHTELDLAAGGRKEGDSMETVREFVEKIVEGLVGNVDDTPIDRLYDHSAYDWFVETYGTILASTLTRLAMSLRQCIDNKPATETPTMAHTALRELVERAVDEARKLPCLGATVSTELHEDSSYSEQNYEDLLATAILNKVIEKFQNERVDGNSNVVQRRIRSKYTNHDNENGLDEGVEEGSSSLEPLSQDECSSDGSGSRTRNSRVRKEPLSLTIEEQIEEVTTTTYGSDDEMRSSRTNVLDFRNSRRVPFPEFGMDIVDPSQDSSDDGQEESNDLAPIDMITPIESWEENWLFQRRKIQTQSEPVSMLVPNPSADYRALIGDKDAEDTSDLSEFSGQSDDEIDDDDELIEAINRSVPETSKDEDTNYHDNAKKWNLRENREIEESSRNESNNLKIENIDETDGRNEFYINEDVKNIFHRNNDEKYENDEMKNSSEIKRQNIDSELSENSHDPENHAMNNLVIPKTPASSPARNSLSNDKPEVPTGCDYRQLNEKLVFIDKINDENSREKETLRDECYDEKLFDKSEKERYLSSCDVNENLKSSTMNGCHEVVSQELPDEVVQRVLENSSNVEIKTNEDEKKIVKLLTITNGSSTEEGNSHCESLARAKIFLTSEKSFSRNSTDNNMELATPPRPGTIAEREHKKWENAAPIENNPYSEENIQKRLLERQYARRSSSDVSGSSAKLPTSSSPPLQIVLGAGRPDSKRFGRDYYINEAKCPNGGSIETGFYTATSRPNSSMSQNSFSTGSCDYEHQERSRSIETESNSSKSSDSRTKIIVDSRGKNNSAINPHCETMQQERVYETRDISNVISSYDERRQSASDVSQFSYDEILEDERKNNKNDINARLNNHENFEENIKSIKRIDLRNYGFTNDFNVKNCENERARNKTKRIIKKLDLRSFGYDSGLRRTQSNNNIDDGLKINASLRSRGRMRNNEEKSNLIVQSERRFFVNSSNEALTKSTESLNDSVDNLKDFGKIKSAKSVPNIDQLCSTEFRRKSRECEFTEDNVGNSGNVELTNFVEKYEKFQENEKNDTTKNHDEIEERNGERNIGVVKKSSLPSVKRLARAFDKTEEITSVPVRRLSKNINNSTKERPTTPEIHIVDTPRQMHSLTARSISREFREGLRQIASPKTTTTSTRKNIINEKTSCSTDFTTNKQDDSSDDTSIMVTGRLKSNIKFWEQMHEKS